MNVLKNLLCQYGIPVGLCIALAALVFRLLGA